LAEGGGRGRNRRRTSGRTPASVFVSLRVGMYAALGAARTGRSRSHSGRRPERPLPMTSAPVEAPVFWRLPRGAEGTPGVKAPAPGFDLSTHPRDHAV